MESRILPKTGHQVEDFIGGIVELGDKLGPLVWQFDKGRRIDAGEFAAFVELLPHEHAGRRLRHVLDVRDPDFIDADYLALARKHGMATVFTDSGEYPSFADLTADFVYARLMRSQAEIEPPATPMPTSMHGASGRCYGPMAAILPNCRTWKHRHRAHRHAMSSFISSAAPRNAIPPPRWHC